MHQKASQTVALREECERKALGPRPCLLRRRPTLFRGTKDDGRLWLPGQGLPLLRFKDFKCLSAINVDFTQYSPRVQGNDLTKLLVL